MSTLRSLSGGCHVLVLAVSLSLSVSLTAQGQYFTGGTPVTELNQAGTSSFSPSVSEDELYMVFASNRPGGLGGYGVS